MSVHVRWPGLNDSFLTQVLSDTGSRPFQCEHCRRSFSRPDSLARHLKRHDRQTHSANLRDTSSADISQNPASYQKDVTAPDQAPPPPLDPSPDSSRQRVLPELAVADLTRTAGATSPQDNTFLYLNWPDSENLLQSILSADLPAWPSFEAPTAQPRPQMAASEELDVISPWWQSPRDQDDTDRGNDAVYQLSHVITSVSADVTHEAQSIGLTSAFLDGCLHMFWNRFVPAFPVVHAPTFVFQDWTYPLILNAIALGSLFTGQEGDATKGEVLWKLAHTAVATSWHTLISHRGPYDSCSGVQLVLTALLGQTYAILSKNIKLRKTAQVFHSLGFFWARETGMYGTQYDQASFTPAFDDDGTSIEYKWRMWAARETQLRALLGHYILDGQISHYTGAPTCQRHSSNPLPLPCADDLFGASTVQQWSDHVRAVSQQRRPFCYFFNALFSPVVHVKHLSQTVSSFSASVAIEGIKSLVSENNTCPIEIVGSPSKLEVSFALGRLYALIVSNQVMDKLQKDQTLLRWHTVCLDAATDFTSLCRNLCYKFGVPQKVLGGKKPDQSFNPFEWLHSAEARFSLLHAVAIHDIISELPLSRTENFHLPMAVMAAAIVYCSTMLSGTTMIALPAEIDWESAIMLGRESDRMESDHESDMLRYVDGLPLKKGINRNIRYDMSLFSLSLRNIGHTWGISLEMHQILEQLLSACNSAPT